MNIWTSAFKLEKRVLWFTPLRRWLFYRYSYNFTPGQLCYLVSSITETGSVPGAIIEVGCAQGHTTVFLNKHLQSSGIVKPYLCIDTFGGFVEQDLAWEVTSRGKAELNSCDGFSINSLAWFRQTLESNGCSGVMCIQTDVKKHLFREPVSFCLCDVDLYKPTLYTLRSVWPVLSPGGIIVVDDCQDENRWDGAYQAYREFTSELGLEATVVQDKLGIIRKA